MRIHLRHNKHKHRHAHTPSSSAIQFGTSISSGSQEISKSPSSNITEGCHQTGFNKSNAKRAHTLGTHLRHCCEHGQLHTVLARQADYGPGRRHTLSHLRAATPQPVAWKVISRRGHSRKRNRGKQTAREWGGVCGVGGRSPSFLRSGGRSLPSFQRLNAPTGTHY